MTLFILNLVMALLWLFLNGSGSFVSFAAGYTIGFGLLWLFQKVLPPENYVRRTLALVHFLGVFVWEFLRSNLTVAQAVVFGRREQLHPNFITYDVSGLTRFEVLLLSHCITLTPGSTIADVSDDWRTLVLHVFDARDPTAVRTEIDRSLRTPLLAFTR